MRFSEALEQAPILRDLGDTLLRYEPSLLIGETRKARSLAGAFLLAGAFALGILAAAAALLPQVHAAIALTLTLGSALLLYASTRREQHETSPRGFVLNFATETLRLERPARKTGNPSTTLIPFDQVRALRTVPRRGSNQGLELTYELAPGRPLTALLVDDIAPSEHEALERARRFLAAAFGLRDPMH